MNRPVYETTKDEARELAIANHVAEMWFATPHKMPKFHEYDWVLCEFGDDVSAYMECKDRSTIEHDQYKYIILSAKKWAALAQMHASTGVPAVVVFRFSDGYYWVNVKNQSMEVKYKGRKDRGDSQDIEACVCIYPDMMKKLKERSESKRTRPSQGVHQQMH